MELETAEFLASALTENGFEASVSSYSGRGMFGRRTSSVSTDASLVEATEIYSVVKSPEYPLFSSFSLDSMGMGIVIY